MNKLPLSLIWKSLGIASLASVGAGAYHIFSGEREVEIGAFRDGDRIVKSEKSKGAWTKETKYAKSRFSIVCRGTGEDGVVNNRKCERYITSNVENGHPIFLVIDKPTNTATNSQSGLGYYKFTYSGDEKIEGEENIEKVYYGQCFRASIRYHDSPNVVQSNPDGNPHNACNLKNIPEGWTRSEIN